ncbi:MAG: hypothetical protein M3N53_09190 [Actinomycetota bacterium]|nr:hypothetical protein [Actinomycetota bacterium]
MVIVHAAGIEPDRAVSETTRLALDTDEEIPIFDQKVVTLVLAERDKDLRVHLHEARQDHRGGLIANCNRMLITDVRHGFNVASRCDRFRLLDDLYVAGC